MPIDPLSVFLASLVAAAVSTETGGGSAVGPVERQAAEMALRWGAAFDRRTTTDEKAYFIAARIVETGSWVDGLMPSLELARDQAVERMRLDPGPIYRTQTGSYPEIAKINLDLAAGVELLNQKISQMCEQVSPTEWRRWADEELDRVERGERTFEAFGLLLKGGRGFHHSSDPRTAPPPYRWSPATADYDGGYAVRTPLWVNPTASFRKTLFPDPRRSLSDAMLRQEDPRLYLPGPSKDLSGVEGEKRRRWKRLLPILSSPAGLEWKAENQISAERHKMYCPKCGQTMIVDEHGAVLSRHDCVDRPR